MAALDNMLMVKRGYIAIKGAGYSTHGTKLSAVK